LLNLPRQPKSKIIQRRKVVEGRSGSLHHWACYFVLLLCAVSLALVFLPSNSTSGPDKSEASSETANEEDSPVSAPPVQPSATSNPTTRSPTNFPTFLVLYQLSVQLLYQLSVQHFHQLSVQHLHQLVVLILSPEDSRISPVTRLSFFWIRIT